MRGVPRWFAVLAVVAMAAVVCAFTVHRALRPATFLLQLSEPDASSRRILLHRTQDPFLQWPRSARTAGHS